MSPAFILHLKIDIYVYTHILNYFNAVRSRNIKSVAFARKGAKSKLMSSPVFNPCTYTSQCYRNLLAKLPQRCDSLIKRRFERALQARYDDGDGGGGTKLHQL